MTRFASLALAVLVGGFAGAAPSAAAELNLFAWSEYIPQSVLDGFTKETGIEVNYETYASNEEMLAKLLSGALMSFTLSLDELIVTYFTASARTRTLPLEIFGRVKKGLDPSLNAISTVFVVFTVFAVFATEALRRRNP